MRERVARRSKPHALEPSRETASDANRGRPLEPAVRAALEPRFGHDFSKVRVHADDWADEAAGTLGASAFTLGSDLHFAAGEYEPGSPLGLGLLAHELAHVVQNERFPGERRGVSRPGDGAEREARAASDLVLGGASVPVSAPPAAAFALAPSSEKESEGPPEWLGTATDLLLDAPQTYGNATEGWNAAIQATGGRRWFPWMGSLPGLPDGLGNGLSIFEGATGLGLGLEKFTRGDTWGGTIQTGQGLADSVSGVAGLAGSNPVSNVAGGISDTLSVIDGFKKMFTGDVKEATEGGHQALEDGFGAVSSFAGGPLTPWGAAASAGKLGAKIGKYAVNASDDYSRKHDLFGGGRSGSEAAADSDWASSVDEAVSRFLPDSVGRVAGGLVAGATGIKNAAYSGLHYVGSEIADGARAVGGGIADGASAINSGFEDLTGGRFTLDPTEIEWDPREWF